MQVDLRVGCAGWTVPTEFAERFPTGGTHLERYATRFSAVELNTSFNKSHRLKTYANWAAMTPDDFRFAVKMPKQVTHNSRLADLSAIGYFLDDVIGLGDKLGILLVQLPPSVAFDPEIAPAFFAALRERYAGGVACEPRHASWFVPDVDAILAQYRIARVAADPSAIATAGDPGGWDGLVYYRLHGSPQVYYSSYADDYIDSLALKLAERAQSAPVWCIFDNTAFGAAMANGLRLTERLQEQQAASNK